MGKLKASGWDVMSNAEYEQVEEAALKAWMRGATKVTSTDMPQKGHRQPDNHPWKQGLATRRFKMKPVTNLKETDSSHEASGEKNK